MSVKRPYLVVDDNGMGGIWTYIDARSPEDIERLYPEFKRRIWWRGLLGTQRSRSLPGGVSDRASGRVRERGEVVYLGGSGEV